MTGSARVSRLLRVLVAEDESIVRLDLVALLERGGFDVCAEAKNGIEAVELARVHEPDLAILDVKMPELDGIEAARRIIGERSIPIVIVSRKAIERAKGLLMAKEGLSEDEAYEQLRTASQTSGRCAWLMAIGAPCVASRRPSHPGDEQRSAKPF